MTPSAESLRDLALDLAREAARLAREMRPDVAVADTKSSAVDVVTHADRAVEDLLVSRIVAARPHDGILGEEGDERLGTSGVRWVVDPIDGTVNYLYGLAECAVSVAVEVEGAVVAGVVVGIGTDVEYAAALGSGATRNGEPIHVRAPAPLAESLVLTGFGYVRTVREHQAACVAALLPEVRDIRRLGACSLDLCHVAEGSADAYVEAGPQPWDWSAGGLVLQEAGGRFGVLTGPPVAPGTGPIGVVTGAPAAGWNGFVEAISTAGFLA